MKLGDQQQQAYRNDGYLFPIDVMTEADAAIHRKRLEALEAQQGAMHYRVKPYLIFSSAWEIATHPALLDAVESVLGPDILLWDSSYIIKEPSSDDFVSWHQDLTYWGLRMQSNYDLVSAWVALTPTNQANGAMRFVRGSHTGGTFTHEDTFADNNLLHRGQTIADNFEPASIEQLELAAGQASFHQGWTVHSSGPNVTGERRVGLVMNYLRPSVRQVVGEFESATLVRGEDSYHHFRPEPQCGNDYAPANVAFQLEMERRKRDVYDTA